MSKSRPSIYLNYLLVLGYRHPPVIAFSTRSQTPDVDSAASLIAISISMMGSPLFSIKMDEFPVKPTREKSWWFQQ